MSNRILFLSLSLLLMSSIPALATHNRAGEISIEQVGDCTNSLTVKATIITYTKASSFQADRDTLTICWGDGTCERVERQNGPILSSEGPYPQGEILENDIKKNIYVAFHTFPARGTYKISMTDPNRNGGILNVNFPNSEMIRFHLETTYTFPNPQFQGCNNTPVLLQPPVDDACVGQPFTHNPNAYDVDGDSLSYAFIVPLQGPGSQVPNYQFPDQINPGPMNNLSINPITGDILWDAPQRAGEYNLAMIIVEWRDGFPLDTIVRDMQINVRDCNNLPPEVETPFEEICVVAGSVLFFPVRATAPLDELNQRVRLTALGGPFEVASDPAQFLPNDDSFIDDPNVKVFRWQTNCSHISDGYYSVVFKATDSYPTALSTLKTVRIKVVGPPPEDVVADPVPGAINVSWALPYVCDDVPNNYFQGFTVWRRVGPNNFPIDTCTTGLEGQGYEKLTTFSTVQQADGRYNYLDVDIIQGRTYCYRIVAEFARTTPGGNFAYNFVESLPSEEGCIRIRRDIPYLTQADVLQTATDEGRVSVCFVPPIAENLDTLLNPGPYTYRVLRAEGIDPPDAAFSPTSFLLQTTSLGQDTSYCFIDEGLNTLETAYSYKVEFYIDGQTDTPFSTTDAASTIFLNVTPGNQQNQLNWSFFVPWNNDQYIVLRQNASGAFDSLGTTASMSFLDTGLVNGNSYCYKILAKGTYGVDNLPALLLNNSQEACASPFDNEPPCPPELSVDDICDEAIDCTNPANLINRLAWTNPNRFCESNDTRAYQVYFAPDLVSDLSPVFSIEGANTTTAEHMPDFGIAGCYAVTAIDTVGNESAFSNVVCVDNCPVYELPNTFTPNNDGSNDRFIPYPYCFIERIELHILNRWGQVVFTTTDPDINWDGTNQNGDALDAGTYVYTCRVFEQRVDGPVEQAEILRGYIQLIRE